MEARSSVVALFLLLLASVKCSQISSALYRNFALVGVLPAATDPSRMNSYVAVASKNQTTGGFSLTSVFHLDEVTGFGSSVALGMAPTGNGGITTIAAVGSKDIGGMISVFDVESDCSSDGCSPVFNYIFKDNNCNAGSTVVAGDKFIAASCSSNLLKPTKKDTDSAFSVCLITDLYNPNQNCSMYYEVPLNTSVCNRQKGGQLVVSSMDARDNMLVIGFCAVCTETVGNSLSIVHHSGFAAYQIDEGGVIPILPVITNKARSISCPSSIAINSQWVMMGYPDEASVDFFYSVSPMLYNYAFNFTVNLDTPANFGSNVDCDESLAIASGRGQAAALSPGGAVIYQFSPQGVQQLDSTIPNLNYLTQFNYTYNVNIDNGTVLVVTQDANLISWGFSTYIACPNGTQWDPHSSACQSCPLGLEKNSNNGNSFALCSPCPAGYFYNQSNCVGGIPCDSIHEYCPPGSSSPAKFVSGYIIESDPDPQATDPLDFENTFYYSCYPYFVVFLTGLIVIGIPLCCTWPNKTMAQKKLVMIMLRANFFYWPTGEEDDFFMEDDMERNPLLGTLNGEIDPEHEEKLNEKRKMYVNQFLGSLCTYLFLMSLVLMIVFGVVFMSHGYNNSITIDLQAIDVSTNPSATNNMNDVFKYLVQIDTSPMLISVTLDGYNGDCTQREIVFLTAGCYNCRTFVTANFNKQGQCIVQAYLPGQLNLDQNSKFIFNFVKPDFYAQQIMYNVSTANIETNSSAPRGNSFFYGVIQPDSGGILRGNATIEIMSILTYIQDCESATPPKNDTKDKSAPLFVRGIVRVNNEYCTHNHGSFKGLASVSSMVQFVPSYQYHDLNVSGYTFNVLITKSPFYKNIQQSYYVSFGTILTITMLAAIDMYWFVEAFTPWLGYCIYAIMTLCLRVWKSAHDVNVS